MTKPLELDLRELLTFDPEGGLIHFAGHRALLMDAVAMGLLRKELISTLGMTAARGLLTRMGYAHGWRTAEAMRAAFPWPDEMTWLKAGGRLHTLQGQVIAEGVKRRPEDGPGPFREAQWRESYEAEQHLLHLGRADQPVCWSLTGFASGFMSYGKDKPIYCVETRCVGQGDAVCQIAGKTAEEWGPGRMDALRFYETRSMDDALAHVTEALKQAEQKLRQKRRTLARVTNAIERAVALCEGSRVEQDDLPEEVRSAPPSFLPGSAPRTLEEMEREYILAVLARNEGNRSRTAEQLDIGLATLYRKLKQYGHPAAPN